GVQNSALLSTMPVVTTRIRAAKSGRLLWLNISKDRYEAPTEIVNLAKRPPFNRNVQNIAQEAFKKGGRKAST
ncbi:MAG: hypothetical protein AAGC54_08880, partial [Cyanobacteria bacterium P01_F01_bin.4]